MANQISLKARALRYLSNREHSRLELARKLQAYVQEGDDVEALLDWLEAQNFLSAERFSQSLINRRGARYGNGRILAELRSHGLQGDDLQQIKTGLDEGELARARALWEKKFGTLPASREERARQQRFFMQRGFSQRTVAQVLRGGFDELEEDGG